MFSVKSQFLRDNLFFRKYYVPSLIHCLPHAGYELWWEVSSVESTREERLLSNSTLKYQLTGLTSTTPYRIQVAALTAAGRGTVTSSTISTGVPPGTFYRRWKNK